MKVLNLIRGYQESLALLDNPNNATMESVKQQKIEKSKRKACIFAALTSTNFRSIMSLKTKRHIIYGVKEIKNGGFESALFNQGIKFQRSGPYSHVIGCSVLPNNVRLLGAHFLKWRIVQNILVTVPQGNIGNSQRTLHALYPTLKKQQMH